jgi:hypothetical protein
LLVSTLASLLASFRAVIFAGRSLLVVALLKTLFCIAAVLPETLCDSDCVDLDFGADLFAGASFLGLITSTSMSEEVILVRGCRIDQKTDVKAPAESSTLETISYTSQLECCSA